MGGSSSFLCPGARKEVPPPPRADSHSSSSSVAATAARTLAFDELAAATRNFRDDFRIIRQHAFDPSGSSSSSSSSSEQLNKEFLARVLTLSSLRHPNVVNLVGFCADGNRGILVHEYMPLGSLQNHLHAAGVAKGLEYLHHQGVVYRKPMSSSDILLGDGYHPKLSQYGLAKLHQLAAEEETFTLSTNIAPEMLATGRVTTKSNVYSFGGVLLELITGRTPFDPAQAVAEDRNLGIWATRLMKDRSQFRWMADPALQDRYPSMDLHKALKVASMCIHQRPAMRSPIGAVVAALSRLAACDDHPPESSHHAAPR
nr:serine/threonine-protein kinase PBL27-like [Aegilops tauschii subsp. strangulata]